MPDHEARKIYEEAAQELFGQSPLTIDELFNNGAVRYRVGQIITACDSGRGTVTRNARLPFKAGTTHGKDADIVGAVELDSARKQGPQRAQQLGTLWGFLVSLGYWKP